MFSILNILWGRMAMDIPELGLAVRARRETLGLTQQQLAKMAGLSRTTVNLLENGSLSDLGLRKLGLLADLLGIALVAVLRSEPPRHALQSASLSASVSYREKLTATELATAFATGEIPDGRLAHVATLIDEAPVSMLISAVEEASSLTSVPAKEIWSHVRRWARHLNSPRAVWA